MFNQAPSKTCPTCGRTLKPVYWKTPPSVVRCVFCDDDKRYIDTSVVIGLDGVPTPADPRVEVVRFQPGDPGATDPSKRSSIVTTRIKPEHLEGPTLDPPPTQE